MSRLCGPSEPNPAVGKTASSRPADGRRLRVVTVVGLPGDLAAVDGHRRLTDAAAVARVEADRLVAGQPATRRPQRSPAAGERGRCRVSNMDLDVPNVDGRNSVARARARGAARLDPHARGADGIAEAGGQIRGLVGCLEPAVAVLPAGQAPRRSVRRDPSRWRSAPSSRSSRGDESRRRRKSSRPSCRAERRRSCRRPEESPLAAVVDIACDQALGPGQSV